MIEYRKILEAWIEYLELEKLHNLKIDASKLSEEKRLTFRRKTEESECTGKSCLEIVENRFILRIPEVEDEDEKEFYLGFPIIEERKNSGTKYIPIFIVKRKLQPTEENGKKIYKLEFDTETDNDFFVAKPVLSRLLDVNPQEFDELIQKKPLISLLIDLLKEAKVEIPEENSFETVFKAFQNWLKKKTSKKKISKQTKIAKFDAIITGDKEFEYFEGQKIEYLLKRLTNTKDYPLKKDSIAHKYLY